MAPREIGVSSDTASILDIAALASVIENLSDGVLVANEEGVIVAINREALRQTGFNSLEEVQHNFPRFKTLFTVRELTGEVLPPADWPLARGLRGEAFRDYEFVLERADAGLRKVCTASATPLMEGSDLRGATITMRDITLKKAAEESLRRSEEQFRLVIESAPNGILLVEEQGEIVMANPQVARAFRYDRDELIGMNVDALVPRRFSGEHASLRQAFAHAPEKRPMGAGRDLFALRKDGTEFPVEIGLTPMWQDGRMRVLVTIVDITERKRAEKALRRSEERTRTLMESVPHMLWVIGASGELEFANERYASYAGSHGQTGVAPPSEIMHPDDRTIFDPHHHAPVLETEHEVRLRRHDGIYRWHLVRLVPIRQGEEDQAWLGTALDIDERKRAEDQMAFLAEATQVLASSLEYEVTLRHVVDLTVPLLADWCALHLYDDNGQLAPVAIAHPDAERAQWAMEVSRRYPSEPDMQYGLARVAATGESLLLRHITDEMLTASARDEEHLQMLRAIGFRSVVAVPLQGREQTLGAMMMVWADSQRLYDDADVRFAEELARRVATAIEHAKLYQDARDAEALLTALNEELEQRVRRRTKKIRSYARELADANRNLERRNRELQEFAYVASHDLQEPLRKIRTFGDLLAMDTAERLNDDERHYLERMQHAAERMSTLIRDLLAFSRVQTKGDSFERVDLADVTREVLGDLQIAIEEVGASVEVGDLCDVEADPMQMRQLMQNLLSNAFKFYHKKRAPRIRVEAEYHPAPEVWGAPGEEICEIRVSDNGVGFESRYVDRIFGPFQRLHGASEYAGTGMGLAIVRRIVERHSGDVTADSTPGEGSTFIVRLPRLQRTNGESA